jgi:large subunit ribosomal protein L22
MISKAQARYIRSSARKARLVADLIRGRSVPQAQAILKNINKRAAKPLEKLLSSALSNLQNKGNVDTQSLYISKLEVNEGPSLKRYRAAAFGRAVMIRRRMCHIKIELDLINQQS